MCYKLLASGLEASCLIPDIPTARLTETGSFAMRYRSMINCRHNLLHVDNQFAGHDPMGSTCHTDTAALRTQTRIERIGSRIQGHAFEHSTKYDTVFDSTDSLATSR